MKSLQRSMILLGMFFWVLVGSSASAANIWYEDNNLAIAGGVPADFQSKFEHPESFSKATGYMDVYMIRANVLKKQNDQFITGVFSSYLERNGIKLAVNAGGATYAQFEGRDKVTQNEIGLFKHLKELGVKVDYISLQSVLSKEPKRDGNKIEYPLNKRLEDIVAFANVLHELYPAAEIGIIDALPSHGKEYRQAYWQLIEAMSATGMKLSYIHLDMPFDIPKNRKFGVTWQSVRDLERFVEDELGLAFGYFTTSRRGGYKSSKDYHQNVIADMECFAGSGGTPRDYIVASWYPYPKTTVPEDATGDDYPAMRTFLEFGRKLERIEENWPAWAERMPSQPEWRSMCGIK